MNPIVFVVFAFVALAAGADNTAAITKISSLVASTKDATEDLLIAQNFLLSCPSSLTLYLNCLTANNYNPYPENEVELCRMARIEIVCMIRAFRTSPQCIGQQDAIAAARRLQPFIDEFCAAVGGAVF